MLSKSGLTLKAASITFTAALFVVVNSLGLFIVSTIQFKKASETERALRYVNEPSIIFSVIISLVIVVISFSVYKLFGFFRKSPLWINGILTLVASSITIYIFSTFSLVGNSGFWNQVRIFLKILALTGLNFFIPYVENFFKKKLDIVESQY